MLCEQCLENEAMQNSNTCVGCKNLVTISKKKKRTGIAGDMQEMQEAVMGVFEGMEDRLPRFNFEIRALLKEDIQKGLKIRATNIIPAGVDDKYVYCVISNSEQTVIRP